MAHNPTLKKLPLFWFARQAKHGVPPYSTAWDSDWEGETQLPTWMALLMMGKWWNEPSLLAAGNRLRSSAPIIESGGGWKEQMWACVCVHVCMCMHRHMFMMVGIEDCREVLSWREVLGTCKRDGVRGSH